MKAPLSDRELLLLALDGFGAHIRTLPPDDPCTEEDLDKMFYLVVQSELFFKAARGERLPDLRTLEKRDHGTR
jgi:hypothetical protein